MTHFVFLFCYFLKKQQQQKTKQNKTNTPQMEKKLWP